MTIDEKKDLFGHISQYISPARAEKIKTIAYQRTRYITVVLEDINQAHNMSAVLRSCDCLGVQDVFIIEDRYSCAINRSVDKGASRWLDMHIYHERKLNNTQRCFEDLRKKGYKIAATTPAENGFTIDELPVDHKVALVFGTENRGLSCYALNNTDFKVKIPMYGFTQSLNVSVSAAICLYELTKKVRDSSVVWQLTDEEIIDLQLAWLGRTTGRTKQIQELINKK